MIETEITEFVADRRLGVHIRSDGHESDDCYDLEPVAGGIRLTYVSDMRLKGPMRLCPGRSPPTPCPSGA